MDGNAEHRLDIVMECRTQEMNSSPRSRAEGVGHPLGQGCVSASQNPTQA